MSDDLIPIILRAGTAAAAAASNRVLLLAEPGFEVDTRRLKVGDGVTAWNDLPYTSVPPDPPAWADFTPSVHAGGGSLGSVSTSGRYKRLGGTVFLRIGITIGSNGDGGGYLAVSGLPFAPYIAGGRDTFFTLAGRQTTGGSAMVTGSVEGGTIYIELATGGYPGGDGVTLVLTGLLEAMS